MREHKRVLLLILIMATASLIVAGIATSMLYRAAFEEERSRLVEVAQSQARLIEAVARFDAAYSSDYPEGSVEATLSQIVDAHKHYRGFGETGEFTLARREGDSIVFLLSHRHYDLKYPKPVPFDSELAEPMRRALLGLSGTVVGLDYRGEVVLAAHEPVAELNLGIVAKIDLAEIRRPFVRAGVITGAFAVLVVLAGATLFLRISDPMIKRLETHTAELVEANEQLKREIGERRRAEEALRESEGKYRSLFEHANDSIFIVDPSTHRFLDANENAAKRLGYIRDELLQLTIDDIDTPMAAQRNDSIIRELLDTGSVTFEHAHLRKDGTKIPVEISSRVIEYGGRQVFESIVRDITERKRAEESLRESEKRYRDLYENAPNAYFSITVDGSVLSCNSAALHLLGYDKKTITRMKVLDLYADTPHGISKAREILKRFQVGESIRDVELQMKRKDGQPIWISLTVEPLKDRDGNVIESRSMVINISERKRAEEALQKAHGELERRVEERTAELKQEIKERKQAEEMLLETKELLESTFSSINLLIAYMDTNFNFIRVNRAYAEADDRAPEFFIGKNHFALFPNKENEAIFRRVVKTGNPYFAFEKPFEYAEHPERGVTYWDWSLQPVKELGEKVSGVVLSLVNVTERKRAQEAQRESEYRYRTLFEESRDAVYITSREGEIIGINQSGLDLFGYTREELMESNIREIYVHPKDRQRFQKVIERKGSVRDYEVKFRKKDGIELDCLLTATVRRADDGSVLGYQGIIRDITDRKRAEAALRESEKQLRYLSSQLLTAQEKERERIARELHDGIGQSLSAVKFSVENSLKQINKETAGPPAKRLEAVIPMIQDSIEEVRKIAMDLRPSVLDDLGILATISWFCREFQTIHSGINIEQQLEIQEDEVPDPLKTSIYRVLQEALNNVAKHSKANLVNISLKSIDGTIELVIGDNGMGFDLEEALSVKSSRKGLGLSSMKERSELSGGSFTIKSVRGAGTVLRAIWRQ